MATTSFSNNAVTPGADADKKMHSPRYRNDLWTLDDGFSLGRAGDQVARMALEVEPPFTLGVTGKWGAGKTSVMRRAFATLGGQPIRQERALAEPGEEGNSTEWKALAWDNEDRKAALITQGWPERYFDATDGVFCVWFSPWQHQNEANPIIPLVREIKAQFEARLNWWQRNTKKAKEKIRESWRSAALASIKLLEQAGDAALSLNAGHSFFVLRGASEAIQQGWQEGENKEAHRLLEPSDGQRFHLLFEDAVDQVLDTLFGLSKKSRSGPNTTKLPPAEDSSPASPRLIIFIDDLDRCEEAVIMRLLEAIKLYLSSRRCVFVLGLDDSAVLGALTRHWRGRSEDNNREYLEKLFQATLAVPLPATPRVREAVARQLDSHQIPHAKRIAEDMERLLEPNPRKIKNFVNGFCATWALHDAAGWLQEEADSKVKNSGELSTEEEHERAVRRFLVFYYLRLYHRPVWRLLERQPESLAILAAVIQGASQGESLLPLEEGTDREQQQLLREFYFRAFSHVLADPVKKNLDEQKERGKIWHGNESLDQAVQHFQERQDRKRSDEYLCQLFRALIPEGYGLNQRYLYLDTHSAPQPAPSPIRTDKP